MTTIKSYTSLEQSKKLAEILPLESADMCYVWDYERKCYTPELFSFIPYQDNEGVEYIDYPCWSLAALIGVLNKSAYFTNKAGIAELSSIKATKWCVSILNCGKIENCYADNPIDACVAMIEKLHELNLL